MLVTEEILSVIKGTKEVFYTISCKDSNPKYPSRIIFLKNYCKNKSIIHVGACDHLPLIDEKLANNTWLHGLFTEHCENVYGIDINKETVEYCHLIGYQNIRCLDLITEVDKVKEWIQIKEKKCNCMVLGEILEHVNNPVSFLQSIRDNYNDVCNEMLITVPNAFCITSFKHALMNKESLNPDHRYYFTPYTLAKVVAEAGLIPKEIIFVGSEGKKSLMPTKLLANTTLICKASFN